MDRQLNKKGIIFKIIGTVITICITACLLCYCTNLMERKASDQKYKAFFDQKEDFDVLFLGTSHVINGVFPMDLWNDYGIVSYNCGGHANQIATSYWVMRNVLERTTPKVVVIDCLEIENNQKTFTDFSYLHMSMDAFPLSVTKIKAIWDLLDDPFFETYQPEDADESAGVNSPDLNGKDGVAEEAGLVDEAKEEQDVDESEAYEKEPRTKIALLWDYAVYHSRWSVIDEYDFRPEVKYEKGAESRLAVAPRDLSRIPENEKIQPGTTGDLYLRKMIEYCQERGIEVVLTFLPFPANEMQQKAANYIYDLAEEYQVEYLNFLDLDVINYHTDLYDEDHVNPSGARKVTDYLGQFLTANYDIPDRRQDSAYASWFDDYDLYENVKNINLTTVNSLPTYLMLLFGDDLEIRIDVRDKGLFQNPWILELFDNLGVDPETLSDKTDYIIINNRESGMEGSEREEDGIDSLKVPEAAEATEVLDGGEGLESTEAMEGADTSEVLDGGEANEESFSGVLVLENIRENEKSQTTELGTFQYLDDKLYLNDQEYMAEHRTDNTGLQIDVYRGTDLEDSIQFETGAADSIGKRSYEES